MVILDYSKEIWYYYTARNDRDIDTISSLKEMDIDLEDKRILLIGEQGLGEELFFLRFVPQLKQSGSWIAYQGDIAESL